MYILVLIRLGVQFEKLKNTTRKLILLVSVVTEDSKKKKKAFLLKNMITLQLQTVTNIIKPKPSVDNTPNTKFDRPKSVLHGTASSAPLRGYSHTETRL